VKLFRVVSNTASDEGLAFAGDIPLLKRPLPGTMPIVVTSLEFDSYGRLFMGGQDGFLRMATFATTHDGSSSVVVGEMRGTVIASPRHGLRQPPSPILSLDISEELEMVATSHANGTVCIYSIGGIHGDATDMSIGGGNDNDPLLGVWNPFSDTNNACHARSVAFVSSSGGDSSGTQNNGNDPSWSIVVGGGNGMLWMNEIHPRYIMTNGDMDADHDVSYDGMHDTTGTTMMPQTLPSLFKENSMQQISPGHRGPVLSLASRPGGILVSAGHDGMLRVTQIWPTPKALYGLGGYNAWIGDICIDSDGKRLLSDGRDDVVVVHNFSKEEEEDMGVYE